MEFRPEQGLIPLWEYSNPKIALPERESNGRQNKRSPADHRRFRPVSSWKQRLADLALPKWHGKPSRRAGRPRACGCPVIFTVLRYGRYPQPEGGGEPWSVVRLAQKKAQADLITGCAGSRIFNAGIHSNRVIENAHKGSKPGQPEIPRPGMPWRTLYMPTHACSEPP